MTILTDNTADLSPQECTLNNIISLPCGVIKGDKEYLVSALSNEIYEDELYPYVLDGGVLKTFRDMGSWYKAINEIDDDILFVGTSPGISGDFKQLHIIKNMIGESEKRIELFDSKMSSAGLHTCVMKAVELRDKGLTLDQTITELEKFRDNIEFVFTCASSEYLNTYGKIDGDKRLEDWPIVRAINGRMTPIGKSSSFEESIDKIISLEIPYNEVFSTVTKDCPQEHIDYVRMKFNRPITLNKASLSILAVAGPGTFTFALVK